MRCTALRKRRSPESTPDLRSESGITLIELAIVGVLAAIVLLALTGFYINSQGSWIEASSQAVTQREVSLALDRIAANVHSAAQAQVNPATSTLILLDAHGTELSRFWVEADSMLHMGDPTLADHGPMGTSKVLRFEPVATQDFVAIRALEMRSATGRRVTMSTIAAFYNK